MGENKYKERSIVVLKLIAQVSIVLIMALALFLLCLYKSIEQDSAARFYNRLKYSLTYIEIIAIIGTISYVFSVILKGITLQGSFKENAINAIKNYPELLFIAIAFIWTFISTTQSIHQVIVWKGNSYNNEGFFTICIYLLIFILAYSMDNNRIKKIAINVFILSATLVSVLSMIEMIQGVDMNFDQSRMVFNNSNHLGYFYVLSTVLALSCVLYSKNIKTTIYYLVIYLISLIGAFISHSEAAILAIIFGCIFTIITYVLSGKNIRENKKEATIKSALIIIIFLLTLLVCELIHISTFISQMKNWGASIFGWASGNGGEAVEDGSLGSGRLLLWRTAITLIYHSPFFGRGLDCYGALGNPLNIAGIEPQMCDMPHNEYLQIAANVGIIPLIFYIAAILAIYIKALINKKNLSAIQLISLNAAFAYCVSAFFGNTFVYTYPLFIIIIAFGAVKKEKTLS